MISVRNNVFETNSSSVHALSFNVYESENYNKTINKKEFLDLVYESEGQTHETLREKLILLVNIIYQNLKIYYEGNRIYTNAKIIDDVLHDRCIFDICSNYDDIEALKNVIGKLGVDEFHIYEKEDSTSNDFKFDWTDDLVYYSSIDDFFSTFVDFTSPEQYTYDTDYSINKKDADFLTNDCVPLADKILLFLNIPCAIEICYGE